jgi:hypothetical protein
MEVENTNNVTTTANDCCVAYVSDNTDCQFYIDTCSPSVSTKKDYLYKITAYAKYLYPEKYKEHAYNDSSIGHVYPIVTIL